MNYPAGAETVNDFLWKPQATVTFLCKWFCSFLNTTFFNEKWTDDNFRLEWDVGYLGRYGYFGEDLSFTPNLEVGNTAEGLVHIYQAAGRHMPWERQITDICVFFILPNSSPRKTNFFVHINFSPINIQQATLDEGGEMLIGLHAESHFCPVWIVILNWRGYFLQFSSISFY